MDDTLGTMKDRDRQQLFLTTQPGWAFATVAELRSHGTARYAAFHHRDSSIVVDAGEGLKGRELVTPDNVYGCIIEARATGRRDATEVLRKRLIPAALRRQVIAWLPSLPAGRQRRYSITTEVYGNTAVHRGRLSEMIEEVLGAALPRWRRTASAGVRLFCKADPRVAMLGVQLYSNLSRDDDGRAGALRDHLACGLLTIARTQPGDSVFDPFAGTGTVLKMALERFEAGRCVGLEVDREAYSIAERRLVDDRVSLINASFEDFDASGLPAATRLVSNVPFGVRFERVATPRLVGLIRQARVRGSSVVLLMSRGQAAELAAPLSLKVKNVLVLGQPASIVHGVA